MTAIPPATVTELSHPSQRRERKQINSLMEALFMKSYRYTLQRYAGPKTKYSCPNCCQQRCFTRYIATETGELLPMQYGRCDREQQCGYDVSPYQVEADGLSYKERVYRQGKEAGKSVPYQTRHSLRLPVPTGQPVLIPDELFKASLTHYHCNQFARLLQEHFGAGVADELLKQFHVGTSAHWPGACVFWFIDEQGGKRAGQIKLFDDAFHTVKGKTTWVHAALKASCNRKRQPCPEWLHKYDKQQAKVSCLFGLSQLAISSLNKPIAIVEAPKTAILCTPYFPDFIWLATGSLSYLTAERLVPLQGRKIMLFPDASPDGTTFEKWQEKAAEFKRAGLTVEVSKTLEQNADDKEKAAGADLADTLLAAWEGYPPGWDH